MTQYWVNDMKLPGAHQNKVELTRNENKTETWKHVAHPCTKAFRKHLRFLGIFYHMKDDAFVTIC